MTWWIGRTCKAGDGRSGAVLTAEPAAPAPRRARARRVTTADWRGGARSGAAPPVPMPTTVVKRPSADDTGGSAPLGQ